MARPRSCPFTLPWVAGGVEWVRVRCGGGDARDGALPIESGVARGVILHEEMTRKVIPTVTSLLNG
jgi:hypothetical protein